MTNIKTDSWSGIYIYYYVLTNMSCTFKVGGWSQDPSLERAPWKKKFSYSYSNPVPALKSTLWHNNKHTYKCSFQVLFSGLSFLCNMTINSSLCHALIFSLWIIFLCGISVFPTSSCLPVTHTQHLQHLRSVYHPLQVSFKADAGVCLKSWTLTFLC